MISKIKKYLTGEFIDELFNFNNSNNINLGSSNTESSERILQSHTTTMVVNSESQTKQNKRVFEGDCV